MNNAVKITRAAVRAADRRRNTRHVGPNVRTLTFYIVMPDDASILGPAWLEQFVIAQSQDATRNAAAEIVREVYG